jgi:glycine/D-amino acid oxidase-like deaminating enzyme
LGGRCTLVAHALAEALIGREGWNASGASRAESAYDAVNVGGGGMARHSLLPSQRAAVTEIAVLEKGWIGGGNTGRNTTIIRLTILGEESASRARPRLWKTSRELNYNVMFSQRG